MQGFKPRDQRDNQSKKQSKQNKSSLGFANGGMIHGPGTGTSDDIEAEMPAGSYVMPADSTEQIGEEGLASMGSPADVNVSNGEYQLPPEQVHAVGVQALDQMKDATHTPVAQGFNPQVNRDGEQFFNQGGQVLDPEEARRKAARTPGLAPAGIALTPEMANANRLAQQRQGGAQAIEQTKQNIGKKVDAAGDAVGMAWDTLAQYPKAGKEFVQNTTFDNRLPGQADRDAKQAAADSARASQWVSANPEQAKQAQAGMQGIADRATKPLIASMSSQQPALPQQQSEASQPVMQATDQPTPLMASQPAAETDPKPSIEQSAAQQPVAGQNPVTAQNTELQTGQNNIIQDGNSFSANGPIRSGYTVNGQAQGGTNIIPGATGFNPNAQSAQNNQAKAALFDRTPEFGAGAGAVGYQPNSAFAMPQQRGPRVTVVGDTSRDERERGQLWNAASTAYKGAQNGQLTAAQINAMRGMRNDERTDATSRRNVDANNAASLAREGINQAGANQREAGRRADQNSQFEVNSSLAERQFQSGQKAEGYQTRAADRLEKAYERFDAAKTPEERSAAAELIRTMSGKDQAPRFAVAAGGQGFNPDGTPYTLPAQVYNQQTGEFVNQKQQQLPPLSENPAAIQIKNNTKLSAAEKAQQLRELGYQ